MRKFFRIVMMTLLLITVGLMSALTAMRIAIHGRETTVPSFVKMRMPDAERLAAGNGLSVTVEGQFYSPDIPEGHVVSQQPPPGMRVRRGWPVRVALSLGVQRVTVPDVTGQSPRAAELNIRQRGLELDTVAEVHIPDVPPEQVVAQSPQPAAAGVVSPKVSMLLSVAPDPPTFVMPNFVGHSLADVSQQIEQAGFKLAHVNSVTDSTTPPGSPSNSKTGASPDSITRGTTVIRQAPAAGQRITADTPIVLEVER
ncbi:MAG TPA: PASTA domain-containing protein [Terriglobales bacterium]|nr:PASTA domain-containing protein [Terriglobales bacterium]